METLQVFVPGVESGGYDVLVGDGIISPELLAGFAGDRQVIVVSDENVKNAGLLEKIDLPADWLEYIISPAGEQSKHIGTITSIIEKMEVASMGRGSIIIGIGGGTVGDMAGFAAAIYKRGIGVVHIPTTTVAQADSSIGGKTGVDSTKSKNAYGCFWQPEGVIIDVSTLKTLDQRQYLSGLVESVKHALIADEKYFKFLEANVDNLIAQDAQSLIELALNNCRIKACVVEQDPTEKNLRRILNYGHTIGHAVETRSQYTLLHGECVGIGMLGASLIEQKMGIGSAKRTERIKKILLALNQPVNIPREHKQEDLLDIISRDKKALRGKAKFALLEDIGKAYQKADQWAHSVDLDVLSEVIQELYEL